MIIPLSKSGKFREIGCNATMLHMLGLLQRLPRNEGDDRIFPLSLTTLKRKLTLLWKDSGLGDVRLHDLRRTHATVLVRNGVDVRTVVGRLGHADLAMVSKVYAVYCGDADASIKAEQAFEALNANLNEVTY